MFRGHEAEPWPQCAGRATDARSSPPPARCSPPTVFRRLFSAVAKKAGVGQGSLYRHFPDRVALAVAVFDENIDQLEASVTSPEATLDDLIDLIIEQALVSTAFIDLIWNDQRDDRVAHIGVRLAALVETVRRASAQRPYRPARRDRRRAARDHDARRGARAIGCRGASALARRAWSLFHAAFAPR